MSRMGRGRYDPKADAFYLRIAPEGVIIEGTQEVAPNVMVDFDAAGEVVGIEVLDVSRHACKATQAQADKSAATE
jgi:uncharacterized protein YuzE